jgi:hypothetical protein
MLPGKRVHAHCFVIFLADTPVFVQQLPKQKEPHPSQSVESVSAPAQAGVEKHICLKQDRLTELTNNCWSPYSASL